MVGVIDGHFFVVGTNFGSQVMDWTGDLELMCWDSYYDDNSGSIDAEVCLYSNVPLPPTAILLGTGLFGLLCCRRFRKS